MATISNGRAIRIPIRDKNNDSARNCFISAYLPAPITFRTPTSLALLDARAVERFMKLIQAITWISTAIRIMIYRKEELTGFGHIKFSTACCMYCKKRLQMQIFCHSHLRSSVLRHIYSKMPEVFFQGLLHLHPV